MTIQSTHHSHPSNTFVALALEATRESIMSAMLTEAQQASLDTLCTQAERLSALDREEDASRTLQIALSLITAGPPAKD